MHYIALIIGMVAVTYIPRMLPLTALKDAKLPAYIERFLAALPAAALGALIVPGVVASVSGSPWIGIVAVAIAGIAVLLRGGMIVGVLVGVGAAWALTLIQG